jgi:hypothetical protein
VATSDRNTIAAPGDAPVPMAAGQAGFVDAPAGSLQQRAGSVLRGHGALIASAIAVVLIVAAQVVEDLSDTPGLQLGPPTLVRERWTAIAVAIYAIAVVGFLRKEALESLDELRPVIGCDNVRFASYRRRMAGLSLRVELALVAFSAASVVLLFVVLGQPLPIADSPRNEGLMPAAPAAALLTLLAWTAFGWAELRLVLNTVVVARTLSQLSREQVSVHVFDTSDLLPFGNIALVAAFAPAGLFAIMLLGLGAPQNTLGWATLVLATGTSLLALILPLRGIHGQMRRAKDEALAGLNSQLTEVHAVVEPATPVPAAITAELNDRTNLLVSLRRVVAEMPTWPFRDTVAFGRALLLASAPVIYAALNGIVDTLVKRSI